MSDIIFLRTAPYTPFSVGRSCQTGCRTDDWSPPWWSATYVL